MFAAKIVTVLLSFGLIIIGLVMDYKWSDKRTVKFRNMRRIALAVPVLLLASNLFVTYLEYQDKKKEGLADLDRFIHNSHVEKFLKYERIYANLSLYTQLVFNSDENSKKSLIDNYRKFSHKYFEFQYQIGRSIESLQRFEERIDDDEISKLLSEYIKSFEQAKNSIELSIDIENLTEYPKIDLSTVAIAEDKLEYLKLSLDKRLK